MPVTRTRVAIVATHPIQYQVPWFQGLAVRPELDLKVYFGTLPDSEQQGTGFGVAFQWDIPMLEGYSWSVLENSHAKPDLSRFFGSSTPGIFEALRRDRPEAVIITGWNALPLLQALLASMWLGIPRIVRGESNAMRSRPYWIRALHRVLLQRYDAFLTIGKGNAAFYRANGVPDSRLFSAPYFVDNARFRKAAQALRSHRAELRREWGIPENAVCFLFAGKLEPKKRILDLVAAMAPARNGRTAMHLLVAGSGVQMEDAKSLALREHVPVSFVGFLNQTQLPRAYAAADCLVLPSDYGETWGLVVNEAMACGLPAVVSDRVGCGPDLVQNGSTGATFPFGDVTALAAVLRSLAASPAQLLELGARAERRVGEYSVERAVEGTLQAIRYLARGPH